MYWNRDDYQEFGVQKKCKNFCTNACKIENNVLSLYQVNGVLKLNEYVKSYYRYSRCLDDAYLGGTFPFGTLRGIKEGKIFKREGFPLYLWNFVGTMRGDADY